MKIEKELVNTSIDKRLKKGLKLLSVFIEEDMNVILEGMIKKKLNESGYDFGDEINAVLKNEGECKNES